MAHRLGPAGVAAIKTAVVANPWTLVPVTRAQRWALLTGHLCRPGGQRAPLHKLPLDVIRRIATRYMVAQGRRTWDGGQVHVAAN
jgi:hypothetical protein